MARFQTYFTSLLALSMFACTGHHDVATVSSSISANLAASAAGTYTGHYSKGMMTLVINYISGNIASGYDIHKGLRRNLNGQVEQNSTKLTFVLKEPGGNPYDGTFFLTYDSATEKIIGKWVPTDSTKAHEGIVNLARMGTTNENDDLGEFLGNLGRLYFGEEGVCTLEYYPSKDENAQLITVKGSYEQIGDTVQIDWQRNDHTPALNMKLIRTKAVEETDSTSSTPRKLVGKGVEFEENNAG
ncbi:MAG: hypothetical protein C5B59_18980 [Bacteroidetes bacterium]|nr:MAG: hypothetical protein C5B59_18980 [Bacteroidota bacterium]